MSIELKFDDPNLMNSPEGRFLVGLGESVANLSIPNLQQLRIEAYPLIGLEIRPAIIISPRPEALNIQEQIGRYEVNYTAQLAICSDSPEQWREAFSWHLGVRDTLLREYSGQLVKEVVVNGDCFELGLEPGLRFDTRVRMKNYLMGYVTVTGRYTADP